MTFKKGQSGNPGGRPKIALPDGRTLTELSREYTVEALATLYEIATTGDSQNARVSAAIALLDRGWGKPRQDLGIDLRSDEATAALLEAARKRAVSVIDLRAPAPPAIPAEHM